MNATDRRLADFIGVLNRMADELGGMMGDYGYIPLGIWNDNNTPVAELREAHECEMLGARKAVIIRIVEQLQMLRAEARNAVMIADEYDHRISDTEEPAPRDVMFRCSGCVTQHMQRRAVIDHCDDSERYHEELRVWKREENKLPARRVYFDDDDVLVNDPTCDKCGRTGDMKRVDGWVMYIK